MGRWHDRLETLKFLNPGLFGTAYAHLRVGAEMAAEAYRKRGEASVEPEKTPEKTAYAWRPSRLRTIVPEGRDDIPNIFEPKTEDVARTPERSRPPRPTQVTIAPRTNGAVKHGPLERRIHGVQSPAGSNGSSPRPIVATEPEDTDRNGASNPWGLPNLRSVGPLLDQKTCQLYLGLPDTRDSFVQPDRPLIAAAPRSSLDGLRIEALKLPLPDIREERSYQPPTPKQRPAVDVKAKVNQELIQSLRKQRGTVPEASSKPASDHPSPLNKNRGARHDTAVRAADNAPTYEGPPTTAQPVQQSSDTRASLQPASYWKEGEGRWESLPRAYYDNLRASRSSWFSLPTIRPSVPDISIPRPDVDLEGIAQNASSLTRTAGENADRTLHAAADWIEGIPATLKTAWGAYREKRSERVEDRRMRNAWYSFAGKQQLADSVRTWKQRAKRAESMLDSTVRNLLPTLTRGAQGLTFFTERSVVPFFEAAARGVERGYEAVGTYAQKMPSAADAARGGLKSGYRRTAEAARPTAQAGARAASGITARFADDTRKDINESTSYLADVRRHHPATPSKLRTRAPSIDISLFVGRNDTTPLINEVPEYTREPGIEETYHAARKQVLKAAHQLFAWAAQETGERLEAYEPTPSVTVPPLPEQRTEPQYHMDVLVEKNGLEDGPTIQA